MKMQSITFKPWIRTFTILSLAIVLNACSAKKEGQQAVYATPEEAVSAFVEALQKDDSSALKDILGPGTDDLLSSGDPIADKDSRADFVAMYQEKHAITADGENKMLLVVGNNEWPMPIPLMKKDGKWYFDGAAGAEELINRRIGGNELGAIAVSRGFVGAQMEYAAEGRDGDEAGIYAMKLISDEGLHNGLYWPTAEGETPSPVGEFIANSAAEGYLFGKEPKPYHGYFYRLLYSQSENAAGGAREYFKDGVLTEGFALIAWPAEYGVSGVQTFIVNQDGNVFQKDLGDTTTAEAETIKSFNPDATWTLVEKTAEEIAAEAADKAAETTPETATAAAVTDTKTEN
ncbi:MAG TPA: DUF2950 domain-containing protein [Arenimonas sp.]|nr:DUF2950 domain-containing protein [Arenimonas sp.]